MPSRADLQEQLQQARSRFDAASAGAPADILETRAICGVWSARDVAGHLADWNEELLAAAEYGAGRRSQPRPSIEDGEAYNLSCAAARSAQSWAQAKADLDGSLDRAAALLAALDEGQLGDAIRLPWGAPGTVSEALADAAGHVDEHAVDLEQGLTA